MHRRAGVRSTGRGGVVKDRFDLEMSRFLDEDPDEHEIGEFAASVTADPDKRAAFTQELRLHVLLRECAAEEMARSGERRSGPVRRVNTRRKRIVALPSRGATVRRIAVAATILICVWILWMVAFGEKGYPAVRISGNVSVRGAVGRGSVLSTGSGRGEVVLGGYARVAMRENTVLRLGGADFSEEVTIEAGGIDCAVDGSVGAFAVDARIVRAEVVGTDFSVTVGRKKPDGGFGKVAVAVRSGRVAVTHEGRRVELTAGMTTEFGAEAADPGVPPRTAGATSVPTEKITGIDVYVSSSSGDNRHDGLSSNAPVKTLQHAYGKMRDGRPDRMLLKRGDTWHEAFPDWQKSGASETQRMTVGVYGVGPRPIIASGKKSGFRIEKQSVTHLALENIEFRADARDPKSASFDGVERGTEGIFIIAAVRDVVFDNLKVSFYPTGLAILSKTGGSEKVSIRNSIFYGVWNINGKPNGIYAVKVDNIAVEKSVFDSIGEGDGLPVASARGSNGINLRDCQRVRVVENVVSRVAGCGIKIGSDSRFACRETEVRDNLLLMNNSGIGLNMGDTTADFAHVDFKIIGNIVALNEASPTKEGMPAYGVWILSAERGRIAGNVFINRREGSWGAVQFGTGSLREIAVSDNVVFGWNMPKGRSPIGNPPPSAQGVRISGNVVSPSLPEGAGGNASELVRNIMDRDIVRLGNWIDGIVVGTSGTPDVSKIRDEMRRALSSAP